MDDCEKYFKALENYKEENVYANIFEKINMRENSHSELLKWLLDVKGKAEDSIQYSFMKEFITYIVDKGYIDKGYINKENIDNFIEKLIQDIDIPEQNTCKFEKIPNCKYIDILLESQSEKFVCVIENKLDATINTDENGKTQLEYYNEYVNNKYKDYEKIFILLSPKIKELENEKIQKICRKEFVTYNSNKFENNFGEYLNALGVYKTIEYSDIVLFIYKFFKTNQYDYNDIKEQSKKFYNVVCAKYNKENKNKEILKNLIKKPFDSFPKLRRFDVPMREIMKEKDIDFIFFVLKQYIEYWEYKSKFIGGGYTKIIDIDGEQPKYLWSILEDIKEDTEYWISLKKNKEKCTKLISIMNQIEKQ